MAVESDLVPVRGPIRPGDILLSLEGDVRWVALVLKVQHGPDGRELTAPMEAPKVTVLWRYVAEDNVPFCRTMTVNYQVSSYASLLRRCPQNDSLVVRWLP